MISIWYGPGGSGKSIHGTGRCLMYLSQGLHVYTNLPLQLDGIERYFYESGTPWRELLHMHKGEEFQQIFKWGVKGKSEARPVKLIWDEASNDLDSYFKGQDLFDLLTWIRLHRHYFFDIELLTQDICLIQARIRAQAHQCWQHCNAVNMVVPGLGWSLRVVGRGWLTVRRVDRANQKPLTRLYWSRIDKEWGACYKTDSEDDARTGEVRLRLSDITGKVTDMTKFQRRALGVALACSILGLASSGAIAYNIHHKSKEPSMAKGSDLLKGAVAASETNPVIINHGRGLLKDHKGRVFVLSPDGEIKLLPGRYRVDPTAAADRPDTYRTIGERSSG